MSSADDYENMLFDGGKMVEVQTCVRRYFCDNSFQTDYLNSTKNVDYVIYPHGIL